MLIWQSRLKFGDKKQRAGLTKDSKVCLRKEYRLLHEKFRIMQVFQNVQNLQFQKIPLEVAFPEVLLETIGLLKEPGTRCLA
jgi:hypothetical protein